MKKKAWLAGVPSLLLSDGENVKNERDIAKKRSGGGKNLLPVAAKPIWRVYIAICRCS